MTVPTGHKKAIEKIATDLLKGSGNKHLPINVDKVAEFVGLKVEPFSFPDEVSGLLKAELGIVGVNSNHHPNRQRFTIAHEIGHYVLGHEIIKDKDLIDDTNTDSSSTNEQEANFFASALLMPASLIKENVKENIDIPKIASLFKVSEQAITIRILGLGLIK